jgi:NDP-4-keto-2,6-dideoxyhexose 3-C-methyltransferase
MTAAEEAAPRPITACRACGHGGLEEVFSLGPQFLSSFPTSAGTVDHPPVPLTLVRCTRPACGLVQLTMTTPPAWLYSTFWYESRINEVMVAELTDLVKQALKRVELPSGSVVVDIGANDGTLLARYHDLTRTRPLIRVGFEPATNLYPLLRPHAEVLYPERFHVDRSWERDQQARIVTAIAMFYDLDDPGAFLDDVRKILHPDGVFIIQVGYLPSMIVQTDVSNVCAEHLAYYDLQALAGLLARHGFLVEDVELRAINAGSIRLYCRHAGWGASKARVASRLEDEAKFFAHPEKVWATFRRRAGQARTQILAALDAIGQEDGVCDWYGASTKSGTLWQWLGVDVRQIRWAWDRSKAKWGRYMGTSGIPIVSEAEGRAEPPNALLLGIFAFKEAVLKREQEYVQAGGSVIVPLPKVEVVRA